MNRRQIFALTFYIIETLYGFLLFVGSLAGLAVLSVGKAINPSTAEEAAYAILEGGFICVAVYSVLACLISIAGIVAAAKKKGGQAILNINAGIVSGYLFAIAIVGFISLSYLKDLGTENEALPTTIRLAFMVAGAIIGIVSMFVRYDQKKKAKCILLIIAASIELLIVLTGSTGSISNASAVFLVLLIIAQLIMPIFYLCSHDNEETSGTAIGDATDPISELNRLQNLLEEGYITEEEFDELRKPYIDKL